MQAPIASRIASASSASLDGVRVHTGPASARAAAAHGARAFTVGRDIHFGAGQFRPNTPAGDRLIAHEVAHAIQPDDSAADPSPARVSARGEPAEDEADVAAASWMSGRSFAPSAPRDAAIYRDDKDDTKRKTFLKEGFTGRETEEEARLIAASKGWVIEGQMRWNGRNWVGENVRKGTGRERAVAQAQLLAKELTKGTGTVAGDINFEEGFSEGTDVYLPGEEPSHKRTFGTGESDTGAESESEGESKEGEPAEEEGSEEKAEGTSGSETGKGTNELDAATALASMVLDPSSLAEGKENPSGESGSPAGGIGWITGPLAKVLTVFAAVFSVFTGPVIKLLGKVGGLAKKAIGSLVDRVRRLFRMTPKTVPPTPPTPPTPPGGPPPVTEPEPRPAGSAADDAIPEEIPREGSGEVTAKILGRPARSGEAVGDFIVVGSKVQKGKTVERDIWGFYLKEKRPAGQSLKESIKSIDDFFGSLIADARALGATELRITGQAIANKNVMKLGGWLEKRFGATVEVIDKQTKVFVFPIR